MTKLKFNQVLKELMRCSEEQGFMIVPIIKSFTVNPYYQVYFYSHLLDLIEIVWEDYAF